MFKIGSTEATRSGKQLRKDLDTIVEYTPLFGASDSEEESNTPKTTRGAP